MTEEEAKQKWCPFVRVLVAPNDATWQGSMVTNRGDVPAEPADTRCLGSDSMAWRPSGTRSNPTGFCGLAGEP